jgi:hypothetical protein
MNSLAQARDAMLQRQIAAEIKKFIAGTKSRRCAWCGALFEPGNRYHFFHDKECRKRWYRGQFRPRVVED